MTSPSLRDVQRWMQARILPGGGATASEASVALCPQGGAPGVERLAVYAGGYLARVEEALAEVYPAVRQVLGHGVFTELAQAYAAQVPSHDYNLSFAGRHLAEFLSAWPRTRELPFLPDLARLEWAVSEAFHAFEVPPLALETLADHPVEAWDQLRLGFQPSVRCVTSVWPILDIWEARTRPVDTVRIALVDRPQQVLVARRGMQVVCAPLTPWQAQFLTFLLAGQSLGAACQQLAEAAGEAPVPVADWCAAWARDGLIANWHVIESPAA